MISISITILTIATPVLFTIRTFIQENRPTDEAIELYGRTLYKGFFGFESMTERSMDDVICGICGVVGELYLGDGNEKNCCSLNEVCDQGAYPGHTLLLVHLREFSLLLNEVRINRKK